MRISANYGSIFVGRTIMAQQVKVSASEGHRSFGKLLKRVYNSDEHLIVERDGFPVAVLISYQEYQQLNTQQALTTFKQFSRELGQTWEEQDVTEAQVLADLEEDKREVYKQKGGTMQELWTFVLGLEGKMLVGQC